MTKYANAIFKFVLNSKYEYFIHSSKQCKLLRWKIFVPASADRPRIAPLGNYRPSL